jgi:hypothetical protein
MMAASWGFQDGNSSLRVTNALMGVSQHGPLVMASPVKQHIRCTSAVESTMIRRHEESLNA